MAIDMNKAKQRMKQLQSQRKDFSKISYGLKYGENVLRFVTPPGQDWPFLYGSWYSGGKLSKQYFISPTMYNEPDPIMEQLELLKNSGNEDDAVAAKKLFPSRRVFGLVLVRGEEDKGIRWVDFPQKVEKELVTYILNEEYGDITDVKKGTDFIITKTKGATFPEYSVVPKRNASELMQDKEKLQEELASIPEFKEAFKHYTYEELQELWSKYLEDDTGESKTDDTETIIPDEEETINISEAVNRIKSKFNNKLVKPSA